MKNFILLTLVSLALVCKAQEQTEFINGTCKINIPMQDTTCQIGHGEGDRNYYRPETIGVRVQGYEDKKLGIDYRVKAVEISATCFRGYLDFRLESPSGVNVMLYGEANQNSPNVGNPDAEDCNDNLIITDTASNSLSFCDCEVPCKGYVRTYERFENWRGIDTTKGLVRYQDSSEFNGLWKLYYCNLLVQEATLTYFNIVFEPINAVGINEKNNQNKSFTIVPNPANKAFKLNLPSSASAHISIYNLSGQKIYTNTQYYSKQSINSSTWPKGIYSIIINQNGDSFAQKLVLN